MTCWDQSNKGYHQKNTAPPEILQGQTCAPAKPVHVQACLHLDDPEESWENVIWSGETKKELSLP